MFKAVFVFSVFAVVCSGAPSRPTGDEYRAELVAAGLSTTAVDGIMKISGEAYANFGKYGKTPDFQDAIEAATELVLNLGSFIKTQSKEDQDAYAAHVEKKKKEYEH